MDEVEEGLNSEYDSRPNPQHPPASQDVGGQTRSGTRHQCSVCNKSFTTASNLNSHLRQVHNGVRHPCSLCSKTFSQVGNLDRHFQVRHKGKRHPCELCNQTFTRLDHLRTHVKEIHKGERKEYKCEQCHKVFAKKDNLKTHQETHSETRFHCDICLQSYSHSKNLKRHVQMKHKQHQEEIPVIKDTSSMQVDEQDHTTRGEEMDGVHSFLVKIEDDSEGEREDEEEL